MNKIQQKCDLKLRLLQNANIFQFKTSQPRRSVARGTLIILGHRHYGKCHIGKMISLKIYALGTYRYRTLYMQNTSTSNIQTTSKHLDGVVLNYDLTGLRVWIKNKSTQM